MRFAREAVEANAASFFLLDPGTSSLRGVASEWDWTRSSFDVELTEWPTTSLCLADGKIRTLTRASATGAERGWFEPRGIESAVCVPLCDRGRPLGVLFFDFDDASARDADDLALLADVGARCGRALGRDSKLEVSVRGRPVVLRPDDAIDDLAARLDAAMTEVARAEELLDNVMQTLRVGPRAEKVAVDAVIEDAFTRLRAARTALRDVQKLIDD